MARILWYRILRSQRNLRRFMLMSVCAVLLGFLFVIVANISKKHSHNQRVVKTLSPVIPDPVSASNKNKPKNPHSVRSNRKLEGPNQHREPKNIRKVIKYQERHKGSEWKGVDRFQFKILEAESQLLASKQFPRARHDVVTHLPEIDTSFMTDVCKGEDVPYLVCLVPSLPKDIHKRHAIRSTWGSAARSGRWARKPLRHTAALLFLFATENYVPHEMDVIRNESKHYRDVIAGKLIDSYRNLTLKLLVGLHLIVTNCPDIKFMVKVDQDTFVNLDLLMDMLDTLLVSGRSTFMLGYHHLRLRPVAVRGDGHWGISERVYPPAFFPRYLYGHSYVVSAELLPTMLHTARRLPYFPSEDAFFTGVLALYHNVTRIHSQRFAVSLRTTDMCDMLSQRFVSVTPTTAEKLFAVWLTLKSGSCDPSDVIKNNRNANKIY